MRLVGATNWFIRVPFLLEGLIQGILGAVIAADSSRRWMSCGTTRPQEFAGSLFGRLTWTSAEFGWVVLVVLGIGAVVGAIGSFLSVTWYLRV